MLAIRIAEEKKKKKRDVEGKRGREGKRWMEKLYSTFGGKNTAQLRLLRLKSVVHIISCRIMIYIIPSLRC